MPANRQNKAENIDEKQATHFLNIQLQKWKKEAKSMPKPSGIDLLSIFRRGVSEKKKRERLKAIENY